MKTYDFVSIICGSCCLHVVLGQLILYSGFLYNIGDLSNFCVVISMGFTHLCFCMTFIEHLMCACRSLAAGIQWGIAPDVPPSPHPRIGRPKT